MEASRAARILRALTMIRRVHTVRVSLPRVAVAAGLALAAWAPAARAQPASSAASGLGFRPYRFVVGALSTSALLHADSVCPSEGSVCPLGGGGGVMVALGRRYDPSREWLLGYDLSVRNARNLFSSATLQAVRFEHRWVYWSTRSNLEAFGGVHVGVALYGERFGLTTLGPLAGVSAGAQYHLSPFLSVGLTLRLEALRFLVPFDTGDGVLRSDGGLATVISTGYLTVTYRGG